MLKKNRSQLITLFIFHLVFAFIFFANFPFGKYFIGWDALNPEFNFSLNFRRVFTAFWQENQGLGLLGGHGFAATLPHNLITFVLSLFIPQKAIRPMFTFLCLYFGGLGMYYLIKKVLKRICKQKKFITLKNFIYPSSLLASFFYMLNLGTLQMFYVQLEAFIFHFALLPWLFYYLIISLFGKKSKKDLIIFFIISFLSSGQGFIPPLFIAYFFALGIFLLFFLKKQKFSRSSIKKTTIIAVITLLANIYWLIPFGYYTFTRSGVYLNSYNNLMSTPEFINRNRKYGNLQNVALIKGFIFENVEWAQDNNVSYVFNPWIKHHQQPLVPIIGYLFFGLILLGLLSALKFFRNYLNLAFIGIFLFFFTGLTTDFFPFSLITAFLQKIPIYKQAFRAAFTKFSIGLAFSYSLFIGIGIFGLVFLILKIIKSKKFSYFVTLVLFLLFFFYTLPYFQGNFLYKRLILDLPKAYLDIFEFFKNKENGRIADFPQDCPGGWYNYKWGYTGSGFYWYGIKQPFLSRTFDVWSNNNENYYWEIVQVLREKNYEKIDSLFEKYDVKWILYDPNVIHCRHPKAFLHFEDFLKYLNSSEKYQLVKTFSSEGVLPIKLYENLGEDTVSFLGLKVNPLNIGPKYNWTDNDFAYFENRDYITNEKADYDIYYPFRSLFTKRKAGEKEFAVEVLKDWVVFKNKVPQGLKDYVLKTESFQSLEKVLPVEFQLKKTLANKWSLYIKYLPPEIYLDQKKLTLKILPLKIAELPKLNLEQISLFVNEVKVDISKNKESFRSVFYPTLENEIKIINQKGEKLLSWKGSRDQLYKKLISQPLFIEIPDYKKGEIEIKIPKIIDDKAHSVEITSNLSQFKPQACNELFPSHRNESEVLSENGQEFIRLKSRNSRQCLVFNFSQLPTSFAYLIEAKTRKISGNNLLFYISNNRRIHYLDLAFYENKNVFKTDYFILPPTFDHELGYDVYFDNFSQNNQETINDFAGFSLWQIPYHFLKSIKLYSPHYLNSPKETQNKESQILSVSHPQETFYKVTINNEQPALPAGRSTMNNQLLVLSQSFDPGWKAYTISNFQFSISPS